MRTISVIWKFLRCGNWPPKPVPEEFPKLLSVKERLEGEPELAYRPLDSPV